MASNQMDINRLGERGIAELVDRQQERIGILSRARDVSSIGDRACLLERGRIALSGRADEVMGWGGSLLEREGEPA